MSSSDTDTDAGVGQGIDRLLDPIRECREQLHETTEPLDRSRLKRTGIVTYFGVYALIALDEQFRFVRALWLATPPIVRPPPIPPLHELLGIYKSFAWGFTSLAVALAVVGSLAFVQLRQTGRGSPESLDDLGRDELTDRRRELQTAASRIREDVERDVERLIEPPVDGRVDLSVVDGSLDVPSEPLSLPRSSDAAAPADLSTAAHAPDTGVLGVDGGVETTDAEVLDDGTVETTDAEILHDETDESAESTSDEGTSDEGAELSSPQPDGGSDPSEPDPDAPWPPNPESEDGAAFDEEAPWPEEWISGDDL